MMKHLALILLLIAGFTAVAADTVTLEHSVKGLIVRFSVKSIEPLIKEHLLQKKALPENGISLKFRQDHDQFLREIGFAADLMNGTATNGAKVRCTGELVEMWCPWDKLAMWGAPENTIALYITISQNIDGRILPAATTRIVLDPPADQKLTAQIMKNMLYSAWQKYISAPEEKSLTDLAEEIKLLAAHKANLADAAPEIAAFDEKSFPQQKSIFRKYYPLLTQDKEIIRKTRTEFLFKYLLNDPEEKQ